MAFFLIGALQTRRRYLPLGGIMCIFSHTTLVRRGVQHTLPIKHEEG